MRKGVAYLFRYPDVSLAANGRYLNALAQVDDPTDAIRTLDRITTRKQIAPRRTAKKRQSHPHSRPMPCHGLIAKIPHSRRGSAAVQLRDVQFPISNLKAAA